MSLAPQRNGSFWLEGDKASQLDGSCVNLGGFVLLN